MVVGNLLDRIEYDSDGIGYSASDEVTDKSLRNKRYDIVPEYAVIGGVPQAVLKDTLTPDRVYSVQRLGQDKMSYYRV